MVLGTRQGLLLGSASRTQLVHPLRTPRAGRLIHAPGTALSSRAGAAGLHWTGSRDQLRVRPSYMEGRVTGSSRGGGRAAPEKAQEATRLRGALTRPKQWSPRPEGSW